MAKSQAERRKKGDGEAARSGSEGPDSSSSRGSKRRKRGWSWWLLRLAAAVPVLAFLFVVLSPGPPKGAVLATQRFTNDTELPDHLRKMLSCHAYCIRNTTKEHEAMAVMIRDRRRARGEPDPTDSWIVFVEDTCVETCQLDYGRGRWKLGAGLGPGAGPAFKTAADLPAEVHAYRACAAGCVEDLSRIAANGQPTAEEAARVLSRCGVVHMEAADPGLLDEISAAYQAVRRGKVGPGAASMMDLRQPPLRSGREEVWLPFEAPFDRFTEFLATPAVAAAVASFFGTHGAAVVDHVNVVNAPGQGKTGRQELHSDYGSPGEHLEVHMPLLKGPVPLEMGPTRFCPCTHGRTDLRDPHERTIRRWFAGDAHCTNYTDLSWVLHAGNSRRDSAGWVSLYDADVFHQGLENESPVDRPVLVAALTHSIVGALERNYVKRNISRPMTDALIRYRHVDLGPVIPSLFAGPAAKGVHS